MREVSFPILVILFVGDIGCQVTDIGNKQQATRSNYHFVNHKIVALLNLLKVEGGGKTSL